MANARLALLGMLTCLLAACAGSTSRKPPAPASESVPTRSPSAESRPKKVVSLTRSDVKEAIARGLGALLQHVTLDDWPVVQQGKFHGFRLRSIDPRWDLDLKPGDVVTRINGIVPEHPEDADAALRSLEKASSLRIDYERDGKAKAIELPIID